MIFPDRPRWIDKIDLAKLNAIDVATQGGREALAEFIYSDAENERTRYAYNEIEIYQKRTFPHVKEFLEKKAHDKHIDEMIIVHDIHLAPRIVNNEAAIYREPPTRGFSKEVPQGVSSEMVKIYNDAAVNIKLKKANRYFKYQSQSFLQVIVMDGRPIARTLKNHQLHIVPEKEDPRKMRIVVIDGYIDTKNRENSSHVVWTKDHNFIMDGKGHIISDVANPDIVSPIQGYLPFIDISDEDEKEGSVWIDLPSDLASFTVCFNAAFTELLHLVRLQGASILTIKGKKEILDQLSELVIGLNSTIKLPTVHDADGHEVETKMEYVTPSPDLNGTIEVCKALLSSYLTTRGVDPAKINMKGDARTFGSGYERLLSLLESFEPAKDDFDIFRRVESELFNLIRVWANNSAFDGAYKVGTINDKATISIQFYTPEITETEAERVDRVSKMKKEGLYSEIKKFEEMFGVDREQALKMIEQKYKDEQEIKALQEKYGIVVPEVPQEGEEDDEEEQDEDTEKDQDRVQGIQDKDGEEAA